MINSASLVGTHPVTEKIKKYTHVRQRTKAICRPLAIEDYVPQPIVDVSPPKWHLAHTTWFFEVFILKRFIPGYQPFHPVYNMLFNSYYNTIGKRTARNERGFLSRPTVQEVYDYRVFVDSTIESIENYITDKEEAEFLQLMEIGCQHEQQHQELLITDLKYILHCNVIKPVYHSPALPAITKKHQIEPIFLPVDEGIYTIGYGGNGFCFDNEQGVHQVFLHEFGIQNRLITNGEYADFIKDGGYRDFRLWLSEGWDLVNREGWDKPLYWQNRDGEYYEYTLMGENRIDKDAPVCHISLYEAAAYAAWAGKRLLTEFEWEVAARQFNPQMQAANTQDALLFHPLPARNDDGLQCHQLFGEVWQWTNSAYLPYPGYTIAPGALGEYNGKFMMNQMVLRGSSCATPANHMRHTYRNFFPANARWQFTGIRLAE